ncbi:MAG: hypothetical protein D6718_02260 [Acidobacteria bacterium]|nr:MAG: hypothetical protein D6718_02260 [Acidobacteriota bacterium]
MSTRRSEQERRVAATCLIVFACFLLAVVLWNTIQYKLPTRYDLNAEFLDKANASKSIGIFFCYLVVSSLGFAGVVGLVHTYGVNMGLFAETVRLAATAYFALNYWLWSAIWIVQHRITLLTETPTNPPDWLLRIFDASDALWALAGWGSIPPGILFSGGVAWLLRRSSRLIPRLAAGMFAALAALQLLWVIYSGLRGLQFFNVGGFTLPYLMDAAQALLQILAYLCAGVALYREKGIFVRTARAGGRG